MWNEESSGGGEEEGGGRMEAWRRYKLAKASRGSVTSGPDETLDPFQVIYNTQSEWCIG